MKRLLLMLTLVMGFITVNAQMNCGTYEYMQSIKAADPTYQQKQDDMEQDIQNYVNSNLNESGIIMEIPCVVHVLWRDSSQNISDEQIYEQIDILNRDYRKLNTDVDSVPAEFQSITTDMQIEFCLKDITRTKTDRIAFYYYGNYIKSDHTGGKSPWDTKEFLNIWVGNLGGGLLGYAQFPNLGADSTDGVAIHYRSVGEDTAKYDLWHPYEGRVLNHEVGHWLNLRHIWADVKSCSVTDFVDDTPNQKYLYRDCWKDTTSCGTRDLVMNYMDYVPTACMRCFTEGQKIRSWGSVSLYRNKIMSNNCDLSLDVDVTGLRQLDIKVYPTLTAQFVNLEIPNLNGDKVSISVFDGQGRMIMSETSTQSRMRINLNGASDGMYYVKVNYQGKITTKQVILNKNSKYGGSLYDMNMDKEVPKDVLEFELKN